jgi:HEAT repeat protein
MLPAALAFALLAFTAQAADSSAKTAKLISVLQSNAGLFEKARACQQLGETGGREAVPALSALLGDPQLSAYARSGLEGIPDPSAAAALRDATGKLKGPQLAGVVNSLGGLRDAEAVGILSKLATDPTSEVAREALLALGNIASPEAVRVLEGALANGPDALRGEAASACLLAAERLRNAGDHAKAIALYDSLRSAKLPSAVRIGATRGAILARDTDRVPFLLEQLRSEELPIRNAALLATREIPSDALAAALNAELTKAKPELQGRLLLALADCHNAESIPAVAAAVQSPDPEIRKTALVVLGKLGTGAAPALLAALQRELSAQEKSAALSGLRGMPGTAVDDLLVQRLSSAGQPQLKIDLIRLLDERGVSKSTGEILKHATGSDSAVSVVALSALKSLAGVQELPALVALIKAAGEEAVRDAAEISVVGICSRSGDGAPAAEAILGELKQASTPAQKNSWIRILTAVGYTNALPAITAAVNDPEETVAVNAITQLGRWHDPAPMEVLLTTMGNGASPILRKRALASVIDLATTATDEAQRPEATIAQWLKQADSAAQSVAEKRRILGIAGRLKTPESLRILAPYLDNAELKTEAASGIVQIGPALAKSPASSELKTALDKIAASAPNPDLQARARQMASTIPTVGARVSPFAHPLLATWEGNTNVWRVRDQEIVGGSMNGNPRNEFLATIRTYTNFVLRLEYRLLGTEGFVNGGVQFRSLRVSDPPNEMAGYQADIGAGYSGCLYDESRRNSFLAKVSDETIKRLEKAGDWNRYEVRCEGPKIQIWLNGEKTVEYTEPDGSVPQSGMIGLQIHGGNKAEISFRNISIQDL